MLTKKLENEKNIRKISMVKDKVEQGFLPISIIADPAIYQLELEYLFPNIWHFLGHQSEIPNEGDYVRRYIGPDHSFVLTRDENGNIRAFFNLCTHKGRGFCASEAGNAAYYRCPYHFWTFKNDGELVSVSLEKEAYNGKLDKKKYGLIEIKVESYNGFIFGNMNHQSESLKNYIGEFSWYTDLVTKRELEFYRPQRWVANFNWKLGPENFASDAYHTAFTHKSASDMGLASMGPFGRKVSQKGYQFSSKKGHGGGMRGAVTEEKEQASVPLPLFYPKWLPKMMPIYKNQLSDSQYELFSKAASSMRWNLFPNFSFLIHPMGSFEEETITSDFPYGEPVPWLHFKIWRPLSVSKTEIWNFFAVEKDAPDKFKRMSQMAYLHSFGPAGMLESDDIENWITITRNSMGSVNSGLNFDSPYLLGDYQQPLKNFVWDHSDEVSIYYEVADHAARAFWKKWADAIIKGVEDYEN